MAAHGEMEAGQSVFVFRRGVSLVQEIEAFVGRRFAEPVHRRRLDLIGLFGVEEREIDDSVAHPGIAESQQDGGRGLIPRFRRRPLADPVLLIDADPGILRGHRKPLARNAAPAVADMMPALEDIGREVMTRARFPGLRSGLVHAGRERRSRRVEPDDVAFEELRPAALPRGRRGDGGQGEDEDDEDPTALGYGLFAHGRPPLTCPGFPGGTWPLRGSSTGRARR